MNQPLVSVICLCYNQGRFVSEAIRSVVNQSWNNVELIVVDDASTDGSAETIERIIGTQPEIKFIRLTTNVGNCKAFNIGFHQSSGSFIIDLAADDILAPDRIKDGVNAFTHSSPETGVQFGDAEYMDETGSPLHHHSDRFPHAYGPTGDIYAELVRRYFICSASMMMRREVLEVLNGYDESLSYEDFDFWIRSARTYQYMYLPKVMVRKRVVADSMSAKQFRRGSPQQKSTLAICRKVLKLNRTQDEDEALRSRCWYEIRQAMKRLELPLAWEYYRLKKAIPATR